MLFHIPRYTSTARFPAASAGDALSNDLRDIDGTDAGAEGDAVGGVGVHATTPATTRNAPVARRERARATPVDSTENLDSTVLPI